MKELKSLLPGLRETLALQQQELAGVKSSLEALKSLKTQVGMKDTALEALEETASELERVIQATVNRIAEIENAPDEPVVFRGRISRQFYYRLKRLPHFGARLRAIREHIEENSGIRITHNQIAEAIGVSNSSISNIENGVNLSPRFTSIYFWCRIFGISMDVIVDSYYQESYPRQFGIIFSSDNFEKVKKEREAEYAQEVRAN